MSKIDFFATFFGFLTSPTLIRDRFGSQNGSPGLTFGWFLREKCGLDYGARFSTIFLEKTQKREKWKSSFRIVTYSVSWGSPCWKIQATMRKNTSFFSLIFHRFLEKNRRKLMQKAWKPALCTKIDEKARSERRFLAKNRFLANFWAPPGSPGPSRDDPENS